MSSFNPAQMETDRLLAQVQMEASGRRNQGIQNIGNAAQSAAQQFQQTMAQNVGLQMQQEELHIRDAEAATKIAGWQQEQELNTFKMQQLMAMDQIAMSRHGVTMAGVQAQSALLDFDQKKQALSSDTLEYRSKAADYALSRGMKYNDTTGGFEKFATPEEHAEAIRNRSMASRALSRSAGDTVNDQVRELTSAAEKARYAGDSQLSRALLAEARALKNMPQDDDDGEQAKAAAKADEAKQEEGGIDPQMVSRIARNAFEAPAWTDDPFWASSVTSDNDRIQMSKGIGLYAAQLMRMRKDLRGYDLDPQQVHQLAMSYAKEDPYTMAKVLWMTGIDSEEIGMRLGVMFKDRPEAQRVEAMKKFSAELRGMREKK